MGKMVCPYCSSNISDKESKCIYCGHTLDLKDASKKKTLYQIYFVTCGPNKVKVIKYIRELLQIGLKEAKDISEAKQEYLLIKGLTYDDAAFVVALFHTIQCTVKMERDKVSTNSIHDIHQRLDANIKGADTTYTGNDPLCPSCGSHQVQAHTSIFRKKTFHCSSCGFKW